MNNIVKMQHKYKIEEMRHRVYNEIIKKHIIFKNQKKKIQRIQEIQIENKMAEKVIEPAQGINGQIQERQQIYNQGSSNKTTGHQIKNIQKQVGRKNG